MPKQRETAVLVMSDLHYGKATSTYNPDVFWQRMKGLGEKVLRIKELLSDYEFDELVLAILGDANDGDGIYPAQPHYQAVSNVEEQANELAAMLAAWTQAQAQVWPRVRIEAVPGNHGRAGRFAHEAANWDITAYRYWKLMLAGCANVTINIPELGHDPFMRIMNVYDHGYLLYHGHDIFSYASIPWYGILNRLLKWHSSIPGWQMALMGHFHTYGDWYINDFVMRCTGTMVSNDDWALRRFGWKSQNRWPFFGVSRKRNSTWTFPLDLVGEDEIPEEPAEPVVVIDG